MDVYHTHLPYYYSQTLFFIFILNTFKQFTKYTLLLRLIIIVKLYFYIYIEHIQTVY